MTSLASLVLVLLAAGSHGLSRDTCSQSERPVAVVPDADAYFLALVDFRSRGTGQYGCGQPRKESMQSFEAMRWALSRLNQESGILDGNYISDTYVPGIKLGMLVEDTCSNAFTASRAVMNTYPQMFSTSRMCNQTSNFLLGAIGGSSPNVTLPVADLLNDFEIPYISLKSASNMQGHMADFLKMVPPDGFQVQVILEVLKSLRWDKVSLVYTNDDYGKKGERQMRESAQQAGICVGTVIRVKHDETQLTTFQDTLRQLASADALGVVVIGNQGVASGLIQAGLTIRGAGKLQWVFSDGLGPNVDAVRNWNYARGIITISPSSRKISEFEDHWLRLNVSDPPADNPWFKEWYMSTNRCRLPGVNYSPYSAYLDCQASSRPAQFVQDPIVEPAIMAVYTYARALKDAHANLCGANFRGACRNLLQLTPVNFYQSYLQRLDFTFTGNERISSLSSNYNGGPKQVKLGSSGELLNAAYDVWNYNDIDGSFKFQKVWTYQDGNLAYNNRVLMFDESRQQSLQNPSVSQCPSSGCGECLSSQELSKNHVYVDGDIIIGGALSVHKMGDNPFTCGPLSMNGGAQLVQAFLYAVNRVSTLGTLRGGIKLGAMIIDDCSSVSMAENQVTNFLTGAETFHDNSDDPIDPMHTVAFTGASSDSITLSLAELSTQLGFSLTGFQAQSHLLVSKEFPYYTSVIPDDQYLINALLALVKRVGWSYMQLIHSDSHASQEFSQKLRMEGAAHDICFSDITVGPTNNASSAVSSVAANTLAKIIVIHLESADAQNFLKELNKTSDATQYAVIAMRDWSTSTMMEMFIQQLRFPVLSITPRVSNFQMYYNYLRSLTPATEDTNPWFNEWYENQFNCYIDPDLPKGYTRQCQDVRNTPITSASNFVLHPNSIYVANAILAVAKGIDGALRHYCGSSYTTVCMAFRTASDRGQVVSANIRNASFVDDAGTIVRLVDGIGSTGFDYFFMSRNNKVKAGDYSTETGQMNVDLSRLNAIRYITSRCASGGSTGAVCPDCGYMYRNQPKLSSVGDVTIGGIFNIHDAGSGAYSCGDIRYKNGYQLSEAFMYAINKVNMGTAPVMLKGIKLGGLVLDACSSSLRANNLVSSVYSGALPLPKGGPVVGWTAAGDSLSLELYSLLNRTQTPFISSTSGTYATEDPTTHFFRTVATDDSRTDALLRLVQYLGWKYVQVVYSSDTQGHNQFNMFRAKAIKEGICILSSYKIGSSASALDAVKGMLTSTSPVGVVLANQEVTSELVTAKESLGFVARSIILLTSYQWGQVLLPETANRSIAVTPHVQDIADFNDYMESQTMPMANGNPWFSQYYESVLECDLGTSNKYRRSCVDVETNPVTSSNRYSQDSGVAATINAIYAMTQALNLTITDLCGPNTVGLCEAARSLDLGQLVNKRLSNVSFTDLTGNNFTFKNKAHERTYDVSLFRNRKFEKVGEYADGTLKLTNTSLQTLYTDVSVTCPDGCLLCRTSMDTQEKFTYIPGDILLGGIFDVHKQGQNSFSCGSINTNQGIQLLEAFNYALEMVNSKQGIFAGRLNGVKLGGVGLDSCKSPSKVGTLIANLHSGILALTEDSGAKIPVEKIDTYIGGYGSDVSERLAEVLSVLAIPQVSYGSTSTIFKNQGKFPYFTRTVPSDEVRARAMIALLKRQNVEYIQVVVSDTVNIKESAEVFMNMAMDKGICVSQNVSIRNANDVTPTSLIDAVSTLLRKKRASVVVTFLEQDVVRQFLEAVEKVSSTDDLRFLGSETWAARRDVLTGLTSSATDALTIAVSQGEDTGFQQYLEGKQPSTYKHNPWFSEYYEQIYQCSLATGSGSFPNQCRRSSRGVTQAPDFEADPYVVHTINAVYAAALGIDRALRRLCGDSYSGVCEAYKRSGDRRQRIMAGIKQARFPDETEQQDFRFQANGESNKGYNIFSVQQAIQGQSFYYVTVGSYNDSHLLRLASSLSLSWSSRCQLASDCSECPSFGKLRTRYMTTPKSNIYVVGFFDVHEAQDVDALRCGHMDTHSGFQSALAFFFAIDQINSKQLSGLQLPSKVRLGGIAVDTCSNHLRVTQDTFTLLLGEGISGSQVLDPANLISVLAMGQDNTKAAADILVPRKMTTINTGPGSSLITEKTHTVSMTSSMGQQALAMATILSYLNLGYVSVVYTDDQQGREGFDMFLEQVNEFNDMRATMCVAKAFVMTNAMGIVRDLDRVAGSRVVVLFTDASDTRTLFQAVKAAGKEERFEWIISDRVDPTSDIPMNLKDLTRGALVLQAHSRPESTAMENFKNYLTTLNVANHGSIPDDWFDEFWQLTLHCRLENSSVPQQNFTRPCRDDDRLTLDLLENDGNPAGVYQTILATYMVVRAANNVQECKGDDDLAACLVGRQDRGDLVYKSLRTSRLVNDIQFNFMLDGSGSLGYDINNIHYDKSVDLYTQYKLGSWNVSRRALSLNSTAFKTYDEYGTEMTTVPISRCPTLTCFCHNHLLINGTPTGSGPDSGESINGDLEGVDRNEYFRQTWGIVVTALTSVGIVCAISSFIYLAVFYPFKGGTTVLGYMLLLGVLCMYILVFAYLVHANDTVCGIRRFCVGFVYAICFSCMIVKVLNNWRLGAYVSEYVPPSKERIAHPFSLFFISTFLILVQVIIGIMWLVLKPPMAYLAEEGIPRCSDSFSGDSDEELVVSLIYVMMLIMVTLVFSAVTWDSEENHRESCWILIATCFTIGIWIAWTVITTMTERVYREPALAIALLLNATLLLLCIFVRKIYLLIRYRKDEEERKSQYAGSSTQDAPSKVNEVYGTLYPNQLYVDNPGMNGSHEKLSHPGSGIVYIYDGHHPSPDVEF